MSSFRTHSSHVSHTPTHSFPYRSLTHPEDWAHARKRARSRAHNNWRKSVNSCRVVTWPPPQWSGWRWLSTSAYVSQFVLSEPASKRREARRFRAMFGVVIEESKPSTDL